MTPPARLNCISQLLNQFDYEKQGWFAPDLGERNEKRPGVPDVLEFKHKVPSLY